MIKVFIEKSELFYPEVKYILEVLFRHFGVICSFEDENHGCDITIGSNSNFKYILNSDVYRRLLNEENLNLEFCNGSGYFYNEKGEVDYLTSAFYMISCAQEFDNADLDEFGRFKFQNSYQNKLGTTSIDLVSKCFELFANKYIDKSFLSKKTDYKRRVFLSHDIDLLNGSIIQDSYFCLKNKRIVDTVKVVLLNCMSRPHWMNMKEICEIESNFGFSSTFFWLPISGSSKFNVKNADYNISSKKVKGLMNYVALNGGENGLHKSISDYSIEEEFKSVLSAVPANRYHFLAFNPHVDLIKLENAGIKFDSSISFAEVPGYRSSYSRPYLPYIFKERRPAKLVECPMNIMDTTFYNYLKFPADRAFDSIIKFIESSEVNSVLGLLWHNNFYSDYKYSSYKKLYQDLLSRLNEIGVMSVNPSEIIKEFGL